MEVKKFYPRVFILITLMFFVYNGQASANSIYTNNANNKIDHLIWSLQNNYLGIKNQAQWEIYIKEARYIIANIPISEKSKAEYLTSKLEKGKSLVEGTASINQLEKSMETNYHGIKNAKQWRGYISFSEKYLSRV
ncbi:MAG: hypothetical protein RR645_01970, partial [Clostridium sp.]